MMKPHQLDQKTLASLMGIAVSTLRTAQQVLPPARQKLYLRYIVAALAAQLKPVSPATLHGPDTPAERALREQVLNAVEMSDRQQRWYRSGNHLGKLYMQRWFQLVTAAIAAGIPPVDALPEPFTRAHRMYDDGMRLSYAEKRPTAQRSKYRNYRPVVLSDGSTVYRRK